MSKAWKEKYKSKNKPKMITNDLGFIFKDVGDKLNYAIFHPDVENGKKILGWIRKYCVDREK